MNKTRFALFLLLFGLACGFGCTIFLLVSGIHNLIDQKIVYGILKVVFCGIGFTTILPFYIVSAILLDRKEGGRIENKVSNLWKRI